MSADGGRGAALPADGGPEAAAGPRKRARLVWPIWGRAASAKPFAVPPDRGAGDPARDSTDWSLAHWASDADLVDIALAYRAAAPPAPSGTGDAAAGQTAGLATVPAAAGRWAGPGPAAVSPGPPGAGDDAAGVSADEALERLLE